VKVKTIVDLVWSGIRVPAGSELKAQKSQGYFRDGKPRWLLLDDNRVRVQNAREEWFEKIDDHGQLSDLHAASL
jgi:hypothetical protein